MNVAVWRTHNLWIVIIIAVAVLYPTVWPHEVGHSVAPYLYGCKKTFWQTDTPWFLLSSWGGKDIDDNCLQRRGHAAAAWSLLYQTLIPPSETPQIAYKMVHRGSSSVRLCPSRPSFEHNPPI